MNTKSRFHIIPVSGLIAGFSVIPLFTAGAIEPPPETNTPPAALLREDPEIHVAAADEPFIGVATADVPDMVADHLGLSDGSGVIIRTVLPDSPAEKGGLAANDIVVRINGKAVADPDAFSALIRECKVGDLLKFDLIHKGKPAELEVTLAKRPADATAQSDSEPMLEGIPKIHADRLRGLIEENLGAFGGGSNGAFPDKQFEETFRLMRERMNRAMTEEIQPAPGNGGGAGFQQNSTIRLMDGEGSVEIKTSDGDTNVTVRGKDNKVEWAGPWNTDTDKDAAPEAIRQRVENIQLGSGNGFSFRFGGLPGKPDTIDN